MLIDRNGRRRDGWTLASDGAIAGQGDVIVPLAVLAEAQAVRTAGQRLGVLVPNSTRPEDIGVGDGRVDLVAVAFPSFSDGRGFSLCRLLRRSGFGGTLRARGPLIADQFAHALACGFDEIELPEGSAARQPEAQWLRAVQAFTLGYQRGYATGPGVLDQRRAARAGGRP